MVSQDLLLLTLYHTIPTFSNPEKVTFKSNVGKGENAGNLLPKANFNTVDTHCLKFCGA